MTSAYSSELDPSHLRAFPDRRRHPRTPARHRRSDSPIVETSGTRLPEPPTDAELYSYWGRQHRWLLAFRALAAVLVAVNLWLFALGRPILVPFTLVATAVLLTNLVNVWTSTRKRTASVVQHRALLASSALRPPSVDVFLPSAGEPLDLLSNTFGHVARMRHPGRVRIYALDDSGRPEVAALAARFGFTYLSRPNAGELKKAGNLRFGLDHSDGDLVVIFDADFVPRPDFLRHVVPYFADTSVGIVQTPQFFDTRGRLGWLESGAGATQELFYRWIQPSRDALGVPICCGTNAVYRRAALRTIGGIPAIDHSEDMYTGFELMKVGYSVRYIPVVVAKGLSPDTVESFVAQQYRWCMGSMCLLLDPTFHRTPMSVTQRLAFYSGLGYYLTTAAFVFLMPLPTLVMVWFMPEYLSPIHYLWLVPALLSYPMTALLHRSDWGLNVLRVQVLYCFAHAIAIVHALRRRSAEWIPTGQRTQRRTVARSIVESAFYWLTLSSIALVAGLGHAAASGASFWALLVVTVFAGGGLAVTMPILLAARRVLENASTTPAPAVVRPRDVRPVQAPVVGAGVEPPTVRLFTLGRPAAHGELVPAARTP